MKTSLIYLAIGSVLLNIYFYVVWTFAYLNTANPAEAKVSFENFFPDLLDGQYLTFFAMILTLGSIFIFAKFKTAGNHLLYTSFIIVQAAFLLLYTWSML